MCVKTKSSGFVLTRLNVVLEGFTEFQQQMAEVYGAQRKGQKMSGCYKTGTLGTRNISELAWK
jgi:hypothetical protein